MSAAGAVAAWVRRGAESSACAACVLEAERRATGKEPQVIAREWLHGICVAKINKASVLAQLLEGKGIAGAHRGERRRASDFPAFAESGFETGPGAL